MDIPTNNAPVTEETTDNIQNIQQEEDEEEEMDLLENRKRQRSESSRNGDDDDETNAISDSMLTQTSINENENQRIRLDSTPQSPQVTSTPDRIGIQIQEARNAAAALYRDRNNLSPLGPNTIQTAMAGISGMDNTRPRETTQGYEWDDGDLAGLQFNPLTTAPPTPGIRDTADVPSTQSGRV